MSKLDMTNVAYSDEYQAYRSEFDAYFAPEYLTDDETFDVGDGYTAARKGYIIRDGDSVWSVSETMVLDASGAEVYRYRNLDDEAEFLTLIHHSDGHNYLLFRIELYGYGVYDLTARREFFYVPKASAFPGADFDETFIWTEVHYNPVNDILAAYGCFWAGPFVLILLRFVNPLEPTEWVDVDTMLHASGTSCDDIDFVRWDGTTLVVNAEVSTALDNGKYDESRQLLELDESRYMSWFTT